MYEMKLYQITPTHFDIFLMINSFSNHHVLMFENEILLPCQRRKEKRREKKRERKEKPTEL